MKHLYFVRHGWSVMNEQGLWSGSIDTPLADKGRAQAKHAGQKAKLLKIDLIIASPLKRTHETAKLIAQEIGYPLDKIELNPLLVERHFGALEGTPYQPNFDIDLANDIADLETHDSLKSRATAFWEYLKTLDQQTILVVSHGSTGRMLRHVIHPDIPFFSKDPEALAKLKFPNGEIIKLL